MGTEAKSSPSADAPARVHISHSAMCPHFETALCGVPLPFVPPDPFRPAVRIDCPACLAMRPGWPVACCEDGYRNWSWVVANRAFGRAYGHVADD